MVTTGHGRCDIVERAELPHFSPSHYFMAMPAVLPRYTIDDLASFPDDGNRYELVDGILLVTPAPMPPHEVVVSRLALWLGRRLGEPSRALVLTHGSVEIAPDIHMEPDVLVV